MTSHSRPHSYVIAASATTGTSIDELIRPGLQRAFPLPPESDANEAVFRRLLDSLSQRLPGPHSQAA